jgi:hypothetical protein
MTFRWTHHSEVTVDRRRVIQRRDFLGNLTLGAAAAGLCSWSDWMTLQAEEMRREGTACILLWLAGGPSQFETFDPKPGHDNGGETKDIATSKTSRRRCPASALPTTCPRRLG